MMDIIYSGKDQEHQNGVAVMMSKEASKALIEWYPVNDQLMYARFDSKHIKPSVIQCYSPTNELNEDEKMSFTANFRVFYTAPQSMT